MAKIQLPFYKKGFDPTDYMDYVQAPDFIQFIQQKQFYLRDLDVSPRIFNQWKNYGLIDEQKPADRKWVTLTFGQFIWLRIIKDLRKFGVPLEDIKRMKERYMVNTYQEIEKSIPKEQLQEMLLKVADSLPNATPEQKAEVMLKLQEKDIWKFLLEEITTGPSNLLEMAILHMVVIGKPVYLTLFLLDGDETTKAAETKASIPLKDSGKRKKARRESCLEFFLDLEEFENIEMNHEELSKLYDAPFLKLPLRFYIKEFIVELKNEKYLEKSMILSSEELVLLKELRSDKVLEITVLMNANTTTSSNSRINRIEVTTELKKEAEARLIETFTSKEYADITYKIAGGEIVSFKKVTKIKP